MHWIATVAVVLGLYALPAPAQGQRAVTLPDQDRRLTLTPADVALIGTAEGESWEMFGGTVRVAFDARENLYVVDPGEARVIVFDRDGGYVRTIGRRGQGPGELMSPVSVVVLDDGRALVNDMGRRGLQVFAADGTYLESLAYDFADGLPGMDIRSVPAGIVAELRRLPFRTSAPEHHASAGRPVAVRPLTSDGKWQTLLEAPAAGESSVVRTGGGPSGAATMAVSIGASRAFSPRFTWDVLPGGGLVAGWEAEYRLRLADPAGRVTAILERPAVAPREVTEADRQAYRKRLEEGGVTINGAGSAAAAMAAQIREQRLANLEFADVMPAISRVLTDPWGRIWVQRSGADTEPGPIDLLTATGDYIGTLPPQPLPDAMGPGGRLAYVETDEETGITRVRLKQMKDGPPPRPVGG